jgi:hypothetical protein
VLIIVTFYWFTTFTSLPQREEAVPGDCQASTLKSEDRNIKYK